MTGAILLAAALAAADPCAPVAPAAERDPAAAAAYRRVGDEERAAGARDTAAVAYREALARDPSDAASRDALGALCRAGAAKRDPFAEGLRLMDAGDPRGAIAAFQEARVGGPDPSAALLQGICEYEIGEDRKAEPLLREAEAAPAHRDAARFYLGLVDLRLGETDAAAALFDSAAANPGFGPMASDLARAARRSGKLVLSFLAESGWDSNVILLPTGAAPSGPVGDGVYALSAAALYRPWGESGPYLRASGVLHHQFQITEFDLDGGSGAAGWQLGPDARHLSAEYDYDYRLLGGSPFLSAHRLLASGALTLGDVVLSATYSIRFESYLSSTYAPFSGVLQLAEARAAWMLGRSLWLAVAYHVGRDVVDQAYAYYSWFEQGPRAELRWQITRDLRLGLQAAVSFRPYDVLDPDALVGVKRSDTYLDGTALVEYELGDRWTARLSVEALRAFSNAAVFDYGKVVPMLGIAYALGL